MATPTNNHQRIEVHTEGFEKDQACGICSESDIGRPTPVASAKGPAVEKWSRKIQVLYDSKPVDRLLGSRELVHLSCHPKIPYHRGCLTTWLNRNASCPHDRRPVSLRVPTVKTAPDPALSLSSTDLKVHNLMARILMGSAAPVKEEPLPSMSIGISYTTIVIQELKAKGFSYPQINSLMELCLALASNREDAAIPATTSTKAH